MGSHLLQNGLSTEMKANDEILSMPFTQEMFAKGFSSDLFVNELGRIRHIMNCLEQKHTQKKLHVLPQYEKEKESTKRKYDLLHKIEDATFMNKMTLLAELRQKVESGQSVDKEFRAHFGEQMGLYTSHQVNTTPSRSPYMAYSGSKYPIALDGAGQIPEQLVAAQAPPTDQVEVFRSNFIADPFPPRATVEQFDSSSIFDAAPSRKLESASGGHTDT